MSSFNSSDRLIPKLSTDISIFNNIQQFTPSQCKDFKSCMATHRLLSSLQYYTSLKSQNTRESWTVFTNFSHQVYKNTLLIQDFYHFQKQHDQQLYHIAKYASDIGKSCGACDVDSCDYTSRHYRVQNICITKDDMDPNIRFYASTLDSFYFYPSHLHHVELRCIEREEDLIEDDDTKDDSYDPEFA